MDYIISYKSITKERTCVCESFIVDIYKRKYYSTVYRIKETLSLEYIFLD